MRAAVVGIGIVSHTLPLSRYLGCRDDVTDVVVFDEQAEPGLADDLVAASHGRRVGRIEDVVAARPDIAFLTGQANTKPGYARQLLMAGVPCVIDKQMAMTHAECLQMQSDAQSAGSPLWALYPYRHRPIFKRLKQFLHGHDLGALRQASLTFDTHPPQDERSHWFRDPCKSAGGGWFAHGDHCIDWMHYLLPDAVVEVRGHMFYDAKDRQEWGGVGSYVLAGGAACVIASHAAGTREPPNRRTEMNALYDRGGFRYWHDFFPTHNELRIRVLHEDDGRAIVDEWVGGPADMDIPTFESGIDTCLRSVAAGVAPASLDVHIAMRVHAVADATYTAARSGRPVTMGKY